MKSTVDTHLLNMVQSHQQHTAAIYISVCVMSDKEHQYTFRTASYSRSHSHTAICYIAISNRQQTYISVCVSCHTKEHQYTFRTASYNRSHSHTAICYIAISNIEQPYISVSVSCHTKNISIHSVLPATAGHTATLQ